MDGRRVQKDGCGCLHLGNTSSRVWDVDVYNPDLRARLMCTHKHMALTLSLNTWEGAYCCSVCALKYVVALLCYSSVGVRNTKTGLQVVSLSESTEGTVRVLIRKDRRSVEYKSWAISLRLLDVRTAFHPIAAHLRGLSSSGMNADDTFASFGCWARPC